MLDNVYYKKHPDDEYVDAITIETIPRYKTSGMSGDEWRFSYAVYFWRKGMVIWKRPFHSIETACAALPWFLKVYMEDADWTPPTHDKDLCFNPGCKNKAVSEYELKEEFSSCGEWPLPSGSKMRRKFCQEHLRRGDCGREDSDVNYIIISGPGPEEHRSPEKQESPSQFGGLIEL